MANYYLTKDLDKNCKHTKYDLDEKKMNEREDDNYYIYAICIKCKSEFMWLV